MANPGHREGQTIFIAAFRDKVEIVVRIYRRLGAACVFGKGLKDTTALVLIKDADSRSFRTGKFGQFEVVINFAFRQFLLCEGSAVVIVEIGPEGRNPCETPAHTLFEGFY